MTDLRHLSAVDVVLTPNCNLSCSYCYQNRHSGRPMHKETLLKAIDLLLESDRDEIWLSFYGGEPLLEFDLIQWAVRNVEARRLAPGRVHYAVSTNGLLLEEETARFFASHRFLTQVSFDGVAASQRFRSAASFEALDSNLDQLRCSLPDFFRDQLSVGVSVFPLNMQYLAESVEYLLGKGVRDIALAPIENWLAGWKLERITELDTYMSQVYDLCLHHFEETGEIPVDILQREDTDEVRRPRTRAMCGVDQAEALTIDANGNVYGCVMFAESYQTFPSEFLSERLRAMRLGPIGGEGFQDRLDSYPEVVRQTEIFHHKELKWSGYGRCRECPILASCQICPVSIGYLPGNTDPRRVPDFPCAFNIVAAKYRQRFPAKPT